MHESELKLLIEALLISAGRPLSMEEMLATLEEWEKPSTKTFIQAISDLENDYQVRALQLKKVAHGYCIQTKERFSPWVVKLLAEKPSKYSRAFLETLAIIAYKQPVTRADIEDIRGVAVSSSILKSLLEREWVRIAGHRDVPGKPAVYTTTKSFLDYFNLQQLEDLPPLPEETRDFALGLEEQPVINDA